jgi:membrane protease YdiL (CAAX protease family)
LAIGAVLVYLGFQAQSTGAVTTPDHELASHAIAIPAYLSAIVLDWALFGYCWAGVRRRGGIWALAGGRWTSWRSLGTDVAVMVPFWLIWEGTASGVAWFLGPNSARALDSLLPQSALEILVWICACASAAICEEIVFRGYLQRQMHALSRTLGVAIVAQGVIFGSFHAYQGWKHVVSISVLGMLYGALAAWRKNLRVNVLSHAWGDMWEGWLKFVVWW